MTVPKNMSLCSSLKSYTKEQTLYEFTIPNPNIAIYIVAFLCQTTQKKKKKKRSKSQAVYLYVYKYIDRREAPPIAPATISFFDFMIPFIYFFFSYIFFLFEEEETITGEH